MIPPPRQGGGGTEAPALAYVVTCAGLVVHVVVFVAGGSVWKCCLVSALLLERCRLRCRSISVEVGTAPSRTTTLRLSSRQAHPPSTCTKDSGQGQRLIDRPGTLTRLTRIARFRESSSSFASSVGNSSWDVKPHLFSMRSLVDTVGDMPFDLAHPSLHVVGRLLVRDIVDYGDVM